MDRHVDIDVDIAGLRKDRVLLLFNGLKLADDATDLRFDVLGHRLEIDRHSGRAAHHGRAAGEKADASPAVDSASKYLTSDRDAAEMSAALTMLTPWLASARGSGRNPGSRALSVFTTKQFRGYLNSMRTSTPKRRVGRPRTGKMPQTALKLPDQLLKRIDKIAHEKKLSRGEIIRQLLTEALDAREHR
jgi:hypothetical protein